MKVPRSKKIKNYFSGEGGKNFGGRERPKKQPDWEWPDSMFSRKVFPKHHLPALISSYLVGDNTSSKKLPATKDSTI